MLKKRSWGRFAAVGILATATGALVIPEAASAVACPVNYVCVYDASNYGTPWQKWTAATLRNNGCTNLNSDLNNSVTSYSNYSSSRFVAFDHANCSDVAGIYQLFPNYSNPNVGSTYNDKATSIAWSH
jgi:hypothetical protein